MPRKYVATEDVGTVVSAGTHTHAAADVTSGTVATARLGSGTANDSSFLRGDQTWAAPTAAAADPEFAPGSFTVETGHFRCHVKRLILTSTERATLQGTATLRIS